MDLLSSQPGRLSIITTDVMAQATISATVRIDIKVGGVSIFASATLSAAQRIVVREGILLTDLAYNQATNTQFMPTLSDAIYMYSFGDHMGDVRIGGICGLETCVNGSVGGEGGLVGVLMFYNVNRVSSRTNPGTVITVQCATQTIEGYLTACQVASISPETRLFRFSMTLRTLPKIP